MKASYFLSTKKTGSHNSVAGFDNFKEWRKNNNRLSFNVGARFDLNRSKDQSGTAVVKDSQWSPRVGVTWDVKGDATSICMATSST